LKDAHEQVRSSQVEAASASAAFEKYINSPESGDHLLHKVYLETTLLAVDLARKNLEEVQRILDLAGMRDLESMIDTHEPLPEIHTLPMLDLLSFQDVLELFVQLSL
jgi:vancomycin permeability regulator SanA